MWISEQFAGKRETVACGIGKVTIGGGHSAVLAAGGEQRMLPVISPGGYYWVPQPGQRVLVLDEGGACVAGAVQPETDLAPGDILICAGEAAIRLATDGTVSITGQVYLNGVPMGGEANGN